MNFELTSGAITWWKRERQREGGGGVLVGWIYFLEQGENPFYALYFLELNYVIFCCNH